jgi:hypothetical protein
MRITIELRRPARRSVALLLITLLLTAPAVVLASHQFPDVPDGHPFHDAIGAIAKAGITTGFTDGTYRPSDPVTRQAMAAFMQRGLGRVGLAAGAAPMTASLAVAAGSFTSTIVAVRQLTITVPGASNDFGPTQLVHLQGRVTFYTSMSAVLRGCPCQFTAHVKDTTTTDTSFSQFQTFTSTSGQLFGYSFDVEALFAAPPGPRTYQLEVQLSKRNVADNAVAFDLHGNSSLSATTFPFGPTGTSDLSAAGALNMAADDDQPLERRPEK